jgi:hypothetical protein
MTWEQIDAALEPVALTHPEHVYRAWCNVAWVPTGSPHQTWADAHDDLDWDAFSLSWRSAGEYVATLRDRGESYMDFYCSGREGQVSDRVRQAMAQVGLRPVT